MRRFLILILLVSIPAAGAAARAAGVSVLEVDVRRFPEVRVLVASPWPRRGLSADPSRWAVSDGSGIEIDEIRPVDPVEPGTSLGEERPVVEFLVIANSGPEDSARGRTLAAIGEYFGSHPPGGIRLGLYVPDAMRSPAGGLSASGFRRLLGRLPPAGRRVLLRDHVQYALTVDRAEGDIARRVALVVLSPEDLVPSRQPPEYLCSRWGVDALDRGTALFFLVVGAGEHDDETLRNRLATEAERTGGRICEIPYEGSLFGGEIRFEALPGTLAAVDRAVRQRLPGRLVQIRGRSKRFRLDEPTRDVAVKYFGPPGRSGEGTYALPRATLLGVLSARPGDFETAVRGWIAHRPAEEIRTLATEVAASAGGALADAWDAILVEKLRESSGADPEAGAALARGLLSPELRRLHDARVAVREARDRLEAGEPEEAIRILEPHLEADGRGEVRGVAAAAHLAAWDRAAASSSPDPDAEFARLATAWRLGGSQAEIRSRWERTALLFLDGCRVSSLAEVDVVEARLRDALLSGEGDLPGTVREELGLRRTRQFEEALTVAPEEVLVRTLRHLAMRAKRADIPDHPDPIREGLLILVRRDGAGFVDEVVPGLVGSGERLVEAVATPLVSVVGERIENDRESGVALALALLSRPDLGADVHRRVRAVLLLDALRLAVDLREIPRVERALEAHLEDAALLDEDGVEAAVLGACALLVEELGVDGARAILAGLAGRLEPGALGRVETMLAAAARRLGEEGRRVRLEALRLAAGRDAPDPGRLLSALLAVEGRDAPALSGEAGKLYRAALERVLGSSGGASRLARALRELRGPEPVRPELDSILVRIVEARIASRAGPAAGEFRELADSGNLGGTSRRNLGLVILRAELSEGLDEGRPERILDAFRAHSGAAADLADPRVADLVSRSVGTLAAWLERGGRSVELPPLVADRVRLAMERRRAERTAAERERHADSLSSALAGAGWEPLVLARAVAYLVREGVTPAVDGVQDPRAEAVRILLRDHRTDVRAIRALADGADEIPASLVTILEPAWTELRARSWPEGLRTGVMLLGSDVLPDPAAARVRSAVARTLCLDADEAAAIRIRSSLSAPEANALRECMERVRRDGEAARLGHALDGRDPEAVLRCLRDVTWRSRGPAVDGHDRPLVEAFELLMAEREHDFVGAVVPALAGAGGMLTRSMQSAVQGALEARLAAGETTRREAEDLAGRLVADHRLAESDRGRIAAAIVRGVLRAAVRERDVGRILDVLRSPGDLSGLRSAEGAPLIRAAADLVRESVEADNWSRLVGGDGESSRMLRAVLAGAVEGAAPPPAAVGGGVPSSTGSVSPAWWRDIVNSEETLLLVLLGGLVLIAVVMLTAILLLRGRPTGVRALVPESDPPDDDSGPPPDTEMLVHWLRSEGFERTREVKQGGVARVFRGEHGRRTHAIKVLKWTHRRNSDLLDKFLQEGEILRKIQRVFDRRREPSPVVRHHWTGTIHRTLPYLALEYIDGLGLDERLHTLPERRFEERQALRIVQRVATGLEVAHALGYFHRDIKPNNILLPRARRPQEEVEGLRLIDFGIAKNVRRDTTASEIRVTAWYMAPEQGFGWSNDAETPTIGPWTDVYSLGVTLYELLSGRVPYDDPNPVVIMQMHASAPVPELPRSAGSSGVRDLVTGMLQKDPGERSPGDMRQLLDRLEALA